MSDDSAEQTVKHVENLAEKAGVSLRPETIEQIRRNKQDEQRQLDELRAQGSQPSIENQDWFKRVKELVDQDRAQELQKQIQSEQGQPAPEAQPPSGAVAPDQAATQMGDQQHSQPPAIGERALADRAETGSEKKDKELYSAEKRLRRL